MFNLNECIYLFHKKKRKKKKKNRRIIHLYVYIAENKARV